MYESRLIFPRRALEVTFGLWVQPSWHGPLRPKPVPMRDIIPRLAQGGQ